MMCIAHGNLVNRRALSAAEGLRTGPVLGRSF